MSTPLIIVDYDLDIPTLLKVAEEAYPTATFYSDDRFPDADFSWWKIGKYDHPALRKIADDFDIEYNPRFYWQEPHSYLPPHTDNGTQCSLNFVLSDDPAPVTIEDTDYYYKAAFLNTTLMHSVKTGDKPRLLLKFSIFDTPIEAIGYKYKYGKENKTAIRTVS